LVKGTEGTVPLSKLKGTETASTVMRFKPMTSDQWLNW
jgi:hypothetical protein